MNTAALLRGIIGFEWRYQTRSLTYAATMLLMAFVSATAVVTGFGPAGSAINGPYIVTETVGIVTLVSVFALPMLCIGAAVRDDEYRMRELIDARPVPRGLLLGGRLAGVLAAALAVMAISLVVQAVGPRVFNVPPERVLAFTALPYLWAFALLVIPNIVFCAAFLHLVAAWSRSTLATFAASIAIYAGYFVTAMMVDSPLMAGTRPPTPELLARVALLDPFGLSAFFEQTRYWTALERNTQLVSLTGNMLWNRLLVLSLGAVCLVPLPWLDRRRALSPNARFAARTLREPDATARAEVSVRDGAAVATTTEPVHVAPVLPAAPSLATRWAATRATLQLEVKLLLRSWPLRALLLMWIALIAIEAHEQLAGGEYGTRMLATSAVLADAVPIGLWLIGTLCAMYFAAEVVGRERILRFDGIRDATPVANSAMLVGKLAALMLVPVLFTVTGYGAAMVVHAVSGGLPIELRTYAAHAMMSLVPLWITTMLAVALQVLLGNRWLGLLAGLVIVFLSEFGASIGLEHLLTRFGATPKLQWSDLDGFGSALPSWVAFNITWALGASVLLGVAAGLWPRGVVLPFVARWKSMPRMLRQGLSRNGLAALAMVTLAFAATYGLMVRETVAKAHWQSEDNALAWRADYERRYRRLQHSPQPQIIDVQLDVALEPEHRRALARGTLTVENRTSFAVDTLWIQPPRDAEDVTVKAPGAASTNRDERFGVYAVTFTAPLAPGARTTVDYSLTIDRSGLRADDFDEDVAANGSFIAATAIVPVIGYQGRYEIQIEREREKRGLGEVSPMLAPASQLDSLVTQARAHGRNPAWYTVHTTVSTSPNQTALGPGDLVRSWDSAGRRHFEYRLDRPSTPYFAIASARYAVERRTYRDVSIELWYHAEHGIHARRIVDIAARALEVLEKNFGRYPHKTLRLIEVPASWGFGAYALTGSIYLTESRGMQTDAREGDVDLLLRRIGHEVAHQWWGHTVDPLWVDGRLAIVETLAKYSEQLLLHGEQGNVVLAKMMSFDHDRYLRGRANTIGLEPTLLTVRDEPHMYYGKGALAFHAMRDVLGDSAIIAALRTMSAEEGGPNGAASVARMHALLLAAARDDDARALVNEWFTSRVIYDLVADSATAQSLGSGTRIQARFRVQRVQTDSSGEHAGPADGALVSVGIYGGTPEQPTLLAMVHKRVAGGLVTVDTTIAAGASFVEIDPGIRLIDRDRANNRLTLVVVSERR